MTASGVACVLGTACVLAFVLAFISGLWGGGDDRGRGNGIDERDDEFVGQHCKKCVSKVMAVFSACV